MRTIKFRAWDKDKKEIREVTGINWYDEYIWVDETPMSGDKLSIENTPLMQFTGLLDKNGKEIYEGDIVHEDNNLSDPYYSPTGVIVYQDYQFVLEVAGHATEITEFNRDELVVIGNIYENPELISNP